MGGDTMKRSTIRVFAGAIAVIFGFMTAVTSTGWDYMAPVLAAKAKYKVKTDHRKKKNYIAVMENRKSYTGLSQSAMEDGLLEEEQSQGLKQKRILVLEMSENEAAQVEEMDGVKVLEEDCEFTANEEVALDEKRIKNIIKKGKKLDFNQWNLDAINLFGNRTATGSAISVDNTSGGSGIRVAVMDSGISYIEGLDVQERIDLVHSDSVESSPLFDDPTGHGTSIAGIISSASDIGAMRGIAENVELYSVKVLDEANTAPLSRVIEGIYWCINNDIDVINMSFGMSQYSGALETAIEAAEAEGITIVAAAGNHGTDAEGLDYPAAFDTVISVGAVNGEMQVCDFTSEGEGLDLLAPGEKVWSYSFFQGLMAVDGTSIATSHVTGAVALLKETYPDADNAFLHQLLKASSVKVDDKQDAGMLDVTGALTMGDGFQMQSQEEKILPQEQNLEKYDTEGIVSGSWGGSDHGNSVAILGSGYELGVAAEMSSLMDTLYPYEHEYEGFAGHRPIHGTHNYVANIHYMYKVASAIRRTTCDLSDETGLSNFINDITSSYVQHTNDISYGDKDFASMKYVINDILRITKKKENSVWHQVGASTQEWKAWAILGVAIHMLGDTYAHRTMLPKSATGGSQRTATSMIKSDFTDWAKFNATKNNAVIEFRDIKNYMKTKSALKYEDYTGFYGNRYTATKDAVANMITAFRNKRDFDVKLIFVDGVKFSLRLNNFSEYAKSAGYNTDVSSMSTKIYRANWKYIGTGKRLNDDDRKDYPYYIC